MEHKKYKTSNFNGAEQRLESYLNDWAEAGYRLVQMIVTPNGEHEPYRFLCIWEAL